MNVLPVLEREMRVAARERNTYRVRFLAALLTVFFSGFSLWFVTLFKSGAIPPRNLFYALIWIAFVFVLIAGFSLSADSISEEKREATLGLLFLTDLKGIDIILGKLGVAILRGVYAVIATFPILALPLMLGGTSLGELVRTLGTLLLTLFFSIIVGMFCSTLLKKSWTAYGISGAAILFFALILPVYSGFLRNVLRLTMEASFVELPSPSYALRMAFAGAGGLSTNRWLLSVGLLIGLCVLLTVAAILILPAIWQERPPKGRGAAVRQFLRDLKFGSPALRHGLRLRMLSINPVYWLSQRERVSSSAFLGLIAALAGVDYFLLHYRWPRLPEEATAVIAFLTWAGTGILLHLAVLLRLPVVASERFSEDRKSGALELLVSTPLTIRSILRGHLLSVLRYFAGPISAAMFFHVTALSFFIAIQPIVARKNQGFGDICGEVLRCLLSASVPPQWENHFIVMIIVGLIPVLMLSWISLCWFSTYLSLRMNRVLAIPPSALMILQFPPWLVMAVLFTFMEARKYRFRTEFNEAFFYYCAAFVFVSASQVFWIWWSRRQLLRDFRIAATDRYQPPKPKRWWHMRVA